MFMIKRQMKLGTALLFGLTGAMIQGAHSLSSTMMKPMLKQHLLFFPARFQQPVPREMYGKFISKLSHNYEVHIASTDSNKNGDLLEKLTQKTDFDTVCLISHSSGVADLWDTYSSFTQGGIDKIILIEPLDLQSRGVGVSLPYNNFFDKFNVNFEVDMLQIDKINDMIEGVVETNYLDLLKSSVFGGFRRQKGTNEDEDEDEKVVGVEQSVLSREMGNMLVVKHKQSDKWRFVPTIPPLSMLNADLMDFQDSMEIDEVFIDKFSHFDILDRPWANLMNRASLRNNKEQQELDEYLNLLDDIVFKLMS